MFASYSLPLLIPIFIAASTAVWFAGVQLSNTTDLIDIRFGIGQALGGLIFLAITTNLPEIAVVISASISHEMGIAIGNILGGIAIQTVILVMLDGFGLKKSAALTYKAASLQLVLEGVLVIIVLVIAIMGTPLPNNFTFLHIAPCDLLIVIAWITGLWLINKARTDLPWHEKGRAPDTTTQPKISNSFKQLKKHSTPYIIFIFMCATTVTFIAGVVLEQSGSAIANHIGWSGVLFGSTILAAVTSLPELTTGLAAIRIRAYTLAISDIFGSNAFLPVLFLPATLLSGHSILPEAQRTDIYLASLGILLTSIYIYGLIFRPKRQIFNLGIDSIVVLILYIVGTLGLFLITNTH